MKQLVALKRWSNAEGHFHEKKQMLPEQLFTYELRWIA